MEEKKLILLTENSSLDKKRLIDHIAEMLEIILGAWRTKLIKILET